MTTPLSRRDVLKSLSIAGAYSASSVVTAQAASYAHALIASEKAIAAHHVYTPKFFPAHQWKTLRSLCETIIPADEAWGGAIEAGAPEFIDLLTSENSEYQLKLGGGLMWLDSACADRFGSAYLDCTKEQQTQMLDTIAYRKNAEYDASFTQGIEFFAFLRILTLDGFVTSKIGIEYLGYIGNTFMLNFPGCPPVEGV